MPTILSSITVDPPQHTSITKSDSSTTGNIGYNKMHQYLKKVKIENHRPTVKLPNNSTITATQARLIPFNAAISYKAVISHIFNGIQ